MDNNLDTFQWEEHLDAIVKGDPFVIQVFWDKYYDDLVQYTKKKIRITPLRTVDEEDIAVSAMQSFFQGISEKRFHVDGNREFWKLLTTIIARKLQKQREKHWAKKRGGGQVRGESVFLQNELDSSYIGGFGALPGNAERPDLSVEFYETTEKLFEMLKEEGTQQVARFLLEGYSIDEIAGQLDCVRRTVERKIERIRTIWGREINHE